MKYQLPAIISGQQLINEILKHHWRHPNQSQEKNYCADWVQLTDPESYLPNDRNLIGIDQQIFKSERPTGVLIDDANSFLKP